MTSEPDKPLPIVYTPEFKRNLRRLAKRYRHIHDDIQPLIDQLVADARPGDQVAGVAHQVFKVRLPNSDARKGKSGGYRIIYHVKKEEIVLVTIYSKSDQADVSAAEIRRIIVAQEDPADSQTEENEE